MHIAFLTPEYPSEISDSGGLANYIHRTSKLLIAEGHDPEVFVLSSKLPSLDYFQKVKIHRVNPNSGSLHYRIFRKILKSFRRPRSLSTVCEWILGASALSNTLERRHKEYAFDIIQSADYKAVGLFVKRKGNRKHIVRCSSAADLYNSFDGVTSRIIRWREWLERRSMRRADNVYAPSELVARHLHENYSINVKVIRPPILIEQEPINPVMLGLPSRYLLHFGLLIRRKGTELLARALVIAWRNQPDLQMVWSGRCLDENLLERFKSDWGSNGNHVCITGALPKPLLYGVLKGADAAILPSQVDNLPNSVIESLIFGIPVIGTRGASIDELVEENITGHLVPRGDPVALADMMVRIWRGESPVKKGYKWNSSVAQDMQPKIAIENLLSLAHMKS